MSPTDVWQIDCSSCVSSPASIGWWNIPEGPRYCAQCSQYVTMQYGRGRSYRLFQGFQQTWKNSLYGVSEYPGRARQLGFPRDDDRSCYADCCAWPCVHVFLRQSAVLLPTNQRLHQQLDAFPQKIHVAVKAYIAKVLFQCCTRCGQLDASFLRFWSHQWKHKMTVSVNPFYTTL